MKLTLSWLHEWVKPKGSLAQLSENLTMSGFEVETIEPVNQLECAAQLASTNKNDSVMDIAVTPNRGDCVSVRGMAREIAAITRSPLKRVSIPAITAKSREKRPVEIVASKECPRYVGRIIQNVNASTPTPGWLRDRLLCCGVKSISIVVDVTNYVMLELGQPMHAFDLSAINKAIRVRFAKKNESITLLDGTTHRLDQKTLVIADETRALAIAGVMGGMDSCVTLTTKDIFLESAYFSPSTVAQQRQRHGLHSESSYRFERGVDPVMQREAMERATQLILQLAGGVAGPVQEVASKKHLPASTRVTLTQDKLTQVLGMTVPVTESDAILKRLGFITRRSRGKWLVQPPSFRPDVALPEDVIEEVARLYGYDRVPASTIKARLQSHHKTAHEPDTSVLRQAMSDQGYHEIVSYSFVQASLQALLDPDISPRELVNPMTADMAVMRTNLWPGLIEAMRYNQNRQQSRIRLFELGTCFIPEGKQLLQPMRLAGLMTGLCAPEQWGEKSRKVDFFDLKGDICNLLSQSGVPDHWHFTPDTHPALHPGQTAAIHYRKQKCGLIGALHPNVLLQLDLLPIGEKRVFVFEMDIKALFDAHVKPFQELSKFPEIRRDIAILINQTVPSTDIQDTIRSVAGTWLKDVFIFDVYQGNGVSTGFKSIALGVILQHPSRTLIDEEVHALMGRVISALTEQLGAELRS